MTLQPAVLQEPLGHRPASQAPRAAQAWQRPISPLSGSLLILWPRFISLGEAGPAPNALRPRGSRALGALLGRLHSPPKGTWGPVTPGSPEGEPLPGVSSQVEDQRQLGVLLLRVGGDARHVLPGAEIHALERQAGAQVTRAGGSQRASTARPRMPCCGAEPACHPAPGCVPSALCAIP